MSNLSEENIQYVINCYESFKESKDWATRLGYYITQYYEDFGYCLVKLRDMDKVFVDGIEDRGNHLHEALEYFYSILTLDDLNRFLSAVEFERS